MLKSLQVLGVELGGYVTDWGNVEDVKDVLLAKTTLFTGEYQVTLGNYNLQFSPEKFGSLFYGRNLFNIDFILSIDGLIVFRGFLKDVQVDHDSNKATLVAQNQFSPAADSVMPPFSITGNPGSVLVAAINAAGLIDFADVPSFLAAGQNAAFYGAEIAVTVTAQDQLSLLDFMQQISELASISVYVENGLLRAKPFLAYQGNSSGLRQEFNPNNVRSFGERQTQYDSFNNQVQVGWGSDKTFVVSDTGSIQKTKVTRAFPFATANGNIISIPDEDSAIYFGELCLQRMNIPPVTFTLEGDVSALTMRLGQRFQLTAPNWGTVKAPVELIEIHRKPKSQSPEMTFRLLQKPTLVL